MKNNTVKCMEITTEFIKRYNISDEDLAQELYCSVLELPPIMRNDENIVCDRLYHRATQYYAKQQAQQEAEILSGILESIEAKESFMKTIDSQIASVIESGDIDAMLMLLTLITR